MSAFVLPPALAARAAAGSLPHGWLLTGAPEERLEETARALAAAFLCEGLGRSTTETGREPGVGSGPVPCGVCKHCRKVERDVHPDLQWVEKPADKSQLVVDQIRALRADAYIRPNEAGRKVYILKNAWQMNDEAQNAFLKVLEEGPAYAVFLLLAENHLAMLPTIRSRCELLRLEGTQATADPELERLGGELAGLLLGEERWRLLAWCVPYEKAKREEVLPLWEAARRTVLTYRTGRATPKAVRLAQTLSEVIAAGRQNGNMGVLWGKLWAQV